MTFLVSAVHRSTYLFPLDQNIDLSVLKVHIDLFFSLKQAAPVVVRCPVDKRSYRSIYKHYFLDMTSSKPVCLVLGGGAGIGYSVARRWAKEGHQVNIDNTS